MTAERLPEGSQLVAVEHLLITVVGIGRGFQRYRNDQSLGNQPNFGLNPDATLFQRFIYKADTYATRRQRIG